VQVIDALEAPGQGSTSASSAIVRFHYFLPQNVAMAWSGYHAWANWSAEVAGHDTLDGVVYRKTGGLMLGAREYLEPITSNLDAVGVPHQMLSGEELRRRFPAMDVRTFGPPRSIDDEAFFADPSEQELHGLFTPDAGYVTDPRAAAGDYARAATALGAGFRFGERVSTITTRRGRATGVKLTGGGRLIADAVVNAAGPASAQLNVLAGVADQVTVRTRPLYAETHQMPAPPGFEGPTGSFVFDTDLGTAFRPDSGGQLHVSSIEPECDSLEWCEDPWDFSRRATKAAFETQALRVARRLPAARIPNRVSGLRDLYDVTDDWNPILDRSPLPGYFLACGTSGNCFKTAPAIAHVLTALVLAGDEAVDSVTLPDATVVDLAPYSCRREVGPSRNVIA
jgi:sarcosine oxidase, subunit beta